MANEKGRWWLPAAGARFAAVLLLTILSVGTLGHMVIESVHVDLSIEQVADSSLVGRTVLEARMVVLGQPDSVKALEESVTV